MTKLEKKGYRGNLREKGFELSLQLAVCKGIGIDIHLERSRNGGISVKMKIEIKEKPFAIV